jgi:hypothetical protein
MWGGNGQENRFLMALKSVENSAIDAEEQPPREGFSMLPYSYYYTEPWMLHASLLSLCYPILLSFSRSTLLFLSLHFYFYFFPSLYVPSYILVI